MGDWGCCRRGLGGQAGWGHVDCFKFGKDPKSEDGYILPRAGRISEDLGCGCVELKVTKVDGRWQLRSR